MKKNAAVIGYGGMGGWHTEHMLKSDVVSLAGIYDIKPERCELAESRGIRAYKSREELLADESVELITVAIPNDDHEEVVIACLNAGKNVIYEKPVTLSMDSLERMIDAANKNGKIFAVHQNRRWDVDYLAMKVIKESGEIGEIINIESLFERFGEWLPVVSPPTGEVSRSTAAECSMTGVFTLSTR